MILKRQLDEVILNKYYYIIIGVLTLLSSCQGTHGKIQSYSSMCSVFEMKNIFNEIDSLHVGVEFQDSTDNSGLNRPGYCDISISEENIITYYKINFFHNEEYWKNHPDDCRFAIIEINGTINSEFGWNSSEKEEGLSLFNRLVVPELEKSCGKIFIE